MKKLLLMGVIPLAIIAVFIVLEATSVLTPLEHRAYDLSLAARPESPVDPRLLLVGVDDPAIEYSGTVWPWPRDLMARGILLMDEFGARSVVMDILYEQYSAPGVNASRFAGAGKTYDEAFMGLKDYFVGLETSLLNGDIPLKEFKSAGDGYLSALDSAKADLVNRLSAITYDRDKMLGNAAAAFGGAYFAVDLNLDMASGRGEKLAALDAASRRKLFTDKITLREQIAARAADIVPPIAPVLQGAKGLGFPVKESQTDQPDGVTRRIHLFYELGDKAIPQLGFAALLDYLGNPAIEVGARTVTLKGAVLLPGKPTDIVIPLAEDGAMLINWTRRRPNESFQNLSFQTLLAHDRLEENITANLKLLAAEEVIGNLRVASGPAELLDAYYAPLSAVRDKALMSGKSADLKPLRRMGDDFAAALDAFLRPDNEEKLVRSVRNSDARVRTQIVDKVRSVFKENRDWFQTYRIIREELSRKMKDAICFTSWTASATTDIGVTPFIGNYENVGTHMSVVNTILQRQFLDDAPRWVTALVTAVFTLLAYFFVFAVKRPLVSVLAGLGTVLAVSGGIILVFVFSGVYLGLVAPVASVLLVFIIFNVFNYLSTARQKNFIRNAFSRYVSKEVVSELVADPSKLNLGGDSRSLTALFTDIKGFSGFSEKLDPPRLVALLNQYFTDMAATILDLKGTLDKYVGDAIVSFFGAPIPVDNHARDACLAAVRMKRAEKEMNDRLIREKIAPKPLLTRIGLNSGNMLVGNMGSENRLSYTVMGHHVNLASRLEGVNKQYGTWILASESTQRAAGDSFLCRRLDRVRVVGIKQPVRLYELIEEKSLVRPELFEAVDIFNQALAQFEKRDWDKARAGFKDVLKLRPDDQPAQLYQLRCLEYRKKPPADDWDGVVNLSAK